MGSEQGSTPNTLVNVVRGLLGVLATAGRAETAASFEAEFTARGWTDLTQADVARLTACIADPAAPGPPRATTDSGSATVSVDEAAQPAAWSPARDFGAFIDAIPRGSALVEGLDELAGTHAGTDPFQAAARIFVRCLGFDAAHLDETSRLGNQRSIRRLRRVAEHGEFVVSLSETDYAGPHPRTQTSVFQLHPYGVVIWVAARHGKVRFVYRDVRTGSLRMRTLVGDRYGREPHDNLVVWAMRLADMVPHIDDDPARLLARVDEALSLEASRICARHASVALDADASPPGIAWEDAARRGYDAFLQRGEQRADRGRPWFWGLERVLRDRFPLPVSEGRHWLMLVGYDVTSSSADDTDAIAVRMRLRLQRDDETADDLTLDALVPTVDAQGRIRSRDDWFVLVPRAQRGGRLLSGIVRGSAEDAEEAVDLLAEPLITGAPPSDGHDEGDASVALDDDRLAGPSGDDLTDDAADAPDDEETPPETTREELQFEGADHCTLFEVAAARKLGALALRLWRAEPSVEGVELAWAGLTDARGRFELLSVRYLKAVLEPAGAGPPPLSTITSAEDDLAAVPPSWACPDLSAALPVGRWYPVAGARLNPAGGLAVPRLVDGATRWTLAITDEPATTANPRLIGDEPSRPEDWIAKPLAPWAHLRPGQLESAAVLAQLPVRRCTLDVLVTRGDHAVLRLNDSAFARHVPPAAPQTLRVGLPAFTDEEPSLHVAPGERVEPGAVWLSCPRRAWQGGAASPWDVESRHGPRRLTTHRLYEQTIIGEDEEEEEEEEDEDWTDWMWTTRHLAWRVPPHLAGVVTAARLDVHTDSYGVRLQWTAELTVQPTKGSTTAWAWLPDGQVVPMERLCEADAPMAATGEVDALLTLDEGSLDDGDDQVAWRDGCTGELLDGARARALDVSIGTQGTPPFTGADPWLRVRLRDGEGIPSSRDSAGLSALDRLMWSIVDPTGGARLDAHERAWSGGAPAYWSALCRVLDAARVPVPSLDPPGGVAPRARLEFVPLRIDATIASGRKRRGDMLDDGFESARTWSCTCGAVEGAHRAHEGCASCGDDCRPSTRPLTTRPVMSLPEPVVHPWRAAATAALLGLTGDELRITCIHSGGRVVADAVRRAWPTPFAAVEARLREDLPKSVRRSLGRGVDDLRCLLEAGTDRHDLVLRWLPRLPSYLHPAGLPQGAPGLVTSPLTKAYQRVARAGRRMASFREQGSQLLLATARFHYVQAVEALFGDPAMRASPGEPGSLATLLLRLWPLSRAARLRSSLPDMALVRGGITSCPRDHVRLDPVPVDPDARAETTPEVERTAVRHPSWRADDEAAHGVPAASHQLPSEGAPARHPIGRLRAFGLQPSTVTLLRACGITDVSDLSWIRKARLRQVSSLDDRTAKRVILARNRYLESRGLTPGTVREAANEARPPARGGGTDILDCPLSRARVGDPRGLRFVLNSLPRSVRRWARWRGLVTIGDLASQSQSAMVHEGVPERHVAEARLRLGALPAWEGITGDAAPDTVLERRLRRERPDLRAVVVRAAGEWLNQPCITNSNRSDLAESLTWAERAATDLFWKHVGVPLTIILGRLTWTTAFDADAPNAPSAATLLEVNERAEPLDGGFDVGRRCANALLARIDAPAALVQALTARKPTWLAHEPQKAYAVVAPLVRRAFPGSEPWRALGRSLLTRILGGWWRVGAGDGGDGRRWRWSAAETVPGGRRALPPLSSDAWLMWPGAAAILRPVHFFAFGGIWTPSVRALARLPVASLDTWSVEVDVPADAETGATSSPNVGAHADAADRPPHDTDADTMLPPVNAETDVAAVAPLPSPGATIAQSAAEADPAPPPATGVRLLSGTLARWMAAHSTPDDGGPAT